MDVAAVLREVDTWPDDERQRLFEALRDRLDDDRTLPPLTGSQRKELDRRLAALEAQPNDVVPWEQAEQYVRRPR